MNGDRFDDETGNGAATAEDRLRGTRVAGKRACPFDVPADELLSQTEFAAPPGQADSDVRGSRIENGFAVAIMRGHLGHHRGLGTAHHVVESAVAEAVVR